MKQTLLCFLLIFGLASAPLLAQNNDASIYEVTDVAVDVTADSAVHARDQAIVQAQRTAFDQLLDRLGVDPAVAGKLSGDDIATLVQNFEVQNERTSSVRYIGAFTVQFRPAAVRSFLGKFNASFSETRSPPVLVLPVFDKDGHPVLWEEDTSWRAAWETAAHVGGLVPIVLASGGLDDIALLSTAEAVDGKADAIKPLIDKYQAGSASVVTLDADLDKPGTEFEITVEHYDNDGNALVPAHLTLPASATKTGIDKALEQAIRLVRHQLEKDWRRQQAKGMVPEVAAVSSTSPEPMSRLPVVVPIRSLAEWAQIKTKIGAAPNVSGVDVITLQRGAVNIEIGFHGSIDSLQAVLMLQGLELRQDSVNNVWVVQAVSGVR